MKMSMLTEILKRTPPWVFILFFVLLAFGCFQSKDRVVSRGRVILLPAAMIMLSIYGVISAFGITPEPLIFWAAGVAFAVWSGLKWVRTECFSFSTETQSFTVPGSWLPLALMMAIFFTKYVVGVIVARKLPIVGALIFIWGVSLIYGLLSGVFLSRGLKMLQTVRKPDHV